MPEQTNLNVSLTPRFMNLLRDRVTSGRYRSASEVIRDGLRLLEERDRREAAFWADARRKVSVGKKQLRAGKGISSDEFRNNMNRYRRRVKAQLKSRHNGSSGKR